MMNALEMAVIRVREANPTDYQDLARIYADTTFARLPAYQRALLVTPRKVALVAEHTVLLVADVCGVVVGGIGISAHKNQLTPDVEPGELQMFWYGVDPHWQGKGIGKLLIASAIASLRSTSYTRLIGQLLESRHAAIRVAESMGAVRNPDRGGINDDGEPYVTFELDLTTEQEN